METYKYFSTEDKSIIYKKINSTRNYYTTIQQIIREGYNQIIITSDILIVILKKFFQNYNLKIVEIELLEDDDDYQNQINNIINEVNENSKYILNLMEELSQFEVDSIEIKKVHVKYREDGIVNEFSISINGILTFFKDKNTDLIASKIADIIIEELGWTIWK